MFSDPQNILNQARIIQGSTVCDLGAGSGFYTLPLSVMVGDKGKVYAVDIQKEILANLAKDVHAKGRHNVETIWGDAEKLGGTKLREALCDLVIVSNIFFQIEKKDVFMDEIRRIVKPKGRVLLVDWTDKGVTKDAAQAMFEKKGFIFDHNVDTGPHHYGMILTKS